MRQFITSVLITALISIILVACSGENKPPTSEMKGTLIQSMPGHVELNSFSLQASQNFGNEVEPNYGSRFKATVSAMVDLYTVDKRNKDVTFVRQVTATGAQTEIFGKITSELYKGAWKHSINIDGQPIRNLGVPLNQISDARVIIRGSDDEKNYYAEIEQKEKERRIEKERIEAEFRKNLANAEKILLGTWREKCGNDEGLTIFKKDGTIYGKWFDGDIVGIWSVEADRLNIQWKGEKMSHNKIIAINSNYFATKGCQDTRIK